MAASTSETPRWRSRTAGILSGGLVALLVVGCAGVDSMVESATSQADRASDDAGAPAEAPDVAVEDDFDDAGDWDEMEEDAEAAEDGASGAPSRRAGSPEGRAVIRTASMHIRARDTAAVAEEVVEVVEDAGGYVSGTDLSRDADGVVAGSFTFRVPSTELTPTLDAFDAAADAVVERRLDEVDVTAELTDLDAEVENLEAYEAELRELLTEVREATTDTEDLLRVFDRVNQVRGQIDQANARRSSLGDQVAMSTIHLRLSPTAATGPVTDPGWAPGETARAALATTMRALTTLADGIIRVGLTVLPVTLVVAAPAVLLLWLGRRWWRRRATSTSGPEVEAGAESGAGSGAGGGAGSGAGDGAGGGAGSGAGGSAGASPPVAPSD